MSDLASAGRTDLQIAAEIAHRLPGGADTERIHHLVRHYEDLLPIHLPRTRGRVLDGVREVLDDLRAREGVLSLLLTGNTHAGARAKLRHYDLDGYFAGGAFADGTADRLDIARNAVALAVRIAGSDFSPQRAFVIGDTPHDIRCAHAIGVRALAVASNAYTEEQLAAHAPWGVFPRLPLPSEFAASIGWPAAAVAVR
jgi:phosphoglycolate phosphatase-like HAD superfamily hydrolase